MQVLRITNESTDRIVAEVPVDTGAGLTLSYVHSIYRQPGHEEFTVQPDGLRLVRLRSGSVPVLEYYARVEPIRSAAAGAEHVIDVAPELHRTLPVLVSALGQRTVTTNGRSYRLHQMVADGDRVRLRVARVPRGKALLAAWPRA